jgi:hypothetical protein
VTTHPEWRTPMKIKATHVTAAALLLSSLSFGASAANLLANGDFEADVGDVADGGYTVVNAGETTINSWTVTGISVDLIRNNYGFINNVSVDLSGSPGPGTISQSFAATAGTYYQLTWDYYKNSSGTDLTVSFGGVDHVYTPVNAITPGSLLWQATSTGPSVVAFSGGAGNAGPTIDNVVLTAVPEPETYAMLLAGLGVIGFLGKRRQR